MVEGVFDELAQAAPAQPLHRRHRRRRDPHLARRCDPDFDIEPDDVDARGVLRPRRRTARSAPTRTRSRSSAKRPTASRRATSSTTRRSRARSRSRTCASGPRPIRSRVPHPPGRLRRVPSVRVPRPVRRPRARGRRRRSFLLNAPYGRRRGLGRAAARGAGADRRQAAALLRRSTPTAVARDAGMGGRINTIMQTCFFAISGVAAARGGDRADQAGDREDLRQEGRRGREAQLRGRRRGARAACTRCRCRRAATATRAPAADRLRRGAGLRPAVTAVMLAGKGDLLPVSAFPVDGTWPIGTAQWEKRNIAHEIPVWDPAICIQCNKCALVCPHAAIRAKVFEPARSTARPPTFKSCRFKALGVRRAGATRSRSRRRTARAARSA